MIVQRFKQQLIKKKHKNNQKTTLITVNHKRCGLNKLGQTTDFMHETIKFYVTVRFVLSEKLA
jgi:hypothetical protein